LPDQSRENRLATVIVHGADPEQSCGIRQWLELVGFARRAAIDA
jgi:hypothetical protein